MANLSNAITAETIICATVMNFNARTYDKNHSSDCYVIMVAVVSYITTNMCTLYYTYTTYSFKVVPIYGKLHYVKLSGDFSSIFNEWIVVHFFHQ